MCSLTLLFSLVLLVCAADAQNTKEEAPHQVCITHLQALDGYPSLARLAGLEGTVTAIIHIASDGSIVAIEASGANEILQDATKRSLKGWKFACLDCATHEPFVQTIRFHYHLLKNSKLLKGTQLEMDLPTEVTFTASPLEPHQ